jgi:hypothetical protein
MSGDPAALVPHAPPRTAEPAEVRTGTPRHRSAGEQWARRAMRSRRRAPAYVALPVAVLLWISTLLQNVQLDRMGTFGLISVLPITYWFGLGVLTLGFVFALRTPGISGVWFLGYVVALIAMLHATPTLLYGTLRYSWAWKHVAVVDYLVSHGGTDPTNGDLGAYSQWPGFFALNALFVRMAGLRSALSYAAWGPPVDNLLLIGPLVLIYRSLTRDRRLVWAAVWVFFSAAWMGQDYFSPQAFAFALYLTVIGLLLRRLNRQAADVRGSQGSQGSQGSRNSRGSPALSDVARRRRGAVIWTALLLPLIAAIASSHQLTPLMLICALGVLGASWRRWRTVLPLFVASVLFAAAWAATVARPFIEANLSSILKSFGALDANASSPMNQATVSPAQQLIAHVEIASAAFIWILALAAVVKWRGLRRGPLVLLAVAPLPLLAANDYGGEMVFRVHLFALPATAFLATVFMTTAFQATGFQAKAVLWRSRRWPRIRALALPVALLALLSGFVLGNYGKERMNYFSPAEVSAAQFLFRTAPPGSMIVAATSEYAGVYTDYADYTYVSWLGNLAPVQVEGIAADPLSALVSQLRDSHGRPAYFILTRSQEAEIELSGLLPPATLTQVMQFAGTVPELTVLYRNQDAVIMELTQQPRSVLLYEEGLSR